METAEIPSSLQPSTSTEVDKQSSVDAFFTSLMAIVPNNNSRRAKTPNTDDDTGIEDDFSSTVDQVSSMVRTFFSTLSGSLS